MEFSNTTFEPEQFEKQVMKRLAKYEFLTDAKLVGLTFCFLQNKNKNLRFFVFCAKSRSILESVVAIAQEFNYLL